MKPLKYGIYALIALLFLGVLWYKGPIAQDPLYHQFADQRTLFGVPNFWNVVSNIPMFFLGLYGFKVVFQRFAWRPDFASRWIPVVLVLGIFITSFGSGYYHYAPDNETLIWDRLPMTLMFMPVFSLLIYDLEGAKAGFWAFVITVPLGLWSIFYWQETEMQGAGDLRPYAFVQFFPMLIGPIMILLARAKQGYIRYFWLVLGWYVIAKVFEHLDAATYEALGFWSGHTLKHLIGAISLYYLLAMVKAWDDSLAQYGVQATKQMDRE
jgi:hypothetical protein